MAICTYIDPTKKVCKTCTGIEFCSVGQTPIEYCAPAKLLKAILANQTILPSVKSMVVPEGCPNGFGIDVKERITETLKKCDL